MKKLVLGVALLSSTFAGAPAQSHAGSHDIVFRVAGTVPCGVLADSCAYNTIASSLGFSACKDPFPPGSWVDIRTEPAPTPPAGKKMLLVLEVTPQVDWDSWICALNGDQLAQGANVLGQPCDNFLGPDSPVPAGCKEKANTVATAGTVYILRNYNYADGADCPGKYTWQFI